MSQNHKAPAFLWYPKDIETDDKVLAMDNREFGVFVHLLDYAWINGAIPSDIGSLARIVRETPTDMEGIWRKVGLCFQAHPSRHGGLVNGRQEEERQRQAEYRAQKQRAAASRWSKRDGSEQSGPIPPPRPKPSPKPAEASGSEPAAGETDAAFDRFWAAFERAGKTLTDHDKASAVQQFISRKWTADELAHLLSSLAIDAESDQWADPQFIPLPRNYLYRELWKRHPYKPALKVERKPANPQERAAAKRRDGQMKRITAITRQMGKEHPRLKEFYDGWAALETDEQKDAYLDGWEKELR